MFELTTILGIFVSVNLAVYYVASEVLNLQRFQFLGAVLGAAILSVLIARAVNPDWKQTIQRIINGEKRAGDVKEDIFGVFAVILGFIVLQTILQVRRYGWQRIAALTAVNVIVGLAA